jgi:hypothetical protein
MNQTGKRLQGLFSLNNSETRYAEPTWAASVECRVIAL